MYIAPMDARVRAYTHREAGAHVSSTHSCIFLILPNIFACNGFDIIKIMLNKSKISVIRTVCILYVSQVEII